MLYITKDKITASEHIPDSYELTAEQERMVSENYPWFELTIEGGVIIAVTPTERPEPMPPKPPEPSPIETLQHENKLLKEQVAALSEQNDFQEELIVELATVVYA